VTLLVASVLVVAVGSDISRAFNSFIAGIFGSFYSITEVLVRATPLILAGLGVAVANAVFELKCAADVVTEKAGGQGAVREVIEMVLKRSDRWDVLMERYRV
jgi:hypothetical protein